MKSIKLWIKISVILGTYRTCYCFGSVSKHATKVGVDLGEWFRVLDHSPLAYTAPPITLHCRQGYNHAWIDLLLLW